MTKSQRKSRHVRIPAVDRATTAKPQDEAPDQSFLVSTLADIVEGSSSAKAKVAQIRNIISAQSADALADDHPFRSIHTKIESVFKQLGSEPQNSVAASISRRQTASRGWNDAVGIAHDLDLALAALVKPKHVRGELARVFETIAHRVATGKDHDATLAELKQVAAKAAANNVPPLPKKAPMLYKDRPDKSQTVVDFLRDDRAWGKWTSAGALSRPSLKKYDIACYDALRVWVQKHGMPADLDIPTKSQVIDRLITSGTNSEVDIARIASAIRSRVSRRNARQP